MGDKIIMSQKELSRMPIIGKIIEKKLSQKDAAKLLNLSSRQINRIVKECRRKPIYEVLRHKNRGKISRRKISSELEQKIKELYQTKYYDFGPTFFGEKLFENHDIKLSKESLRKILIKNGLWQKREIKKKTCHIWRERKEHFGELVQFDGSHHRWLEDRLDKEFCLLVFIDDATGSVFARFYEYEGTLPGIVFLKKFIEKYGLPKAIYCDRHSAYYTTRYQNYEEQLENKFPKTGFAKVVESLKIELIHARSPQAKGRVERVNKTLQDRLIKEMRLLDIKTINEANYFLETTFLSEFNKKFTVMPKSDVSFFKPFTRAIKLDDICTISHSRIFYYSFAKSSFLAFKQNAKNEKEKSYYKTIS